MKNEEKIVSLLEEIKNILKGQKVKCSRFVDNGDGTISDPKTGLMWVKNPHTDLPSAFKNEMNWQSAVDSCGELNFAGYDDWRLPTVEELFSIVDYSKGAKSGEPAIDTAIFPDTKCSCYWTVTPTAWGSGGAWGVGFGYGDVVGSDKGSRVYVRPVRASK